MFNNIINNNYITPIERPPNFEITKKDNISEKLRSLLIGESLIVKSKLSSRYVYKSAYRQGIKIKVRDKTITRIK